MNKIRYFVVVVGLFIAFDVVADINIGNFENPIEVEFIFSASKSQSVTMIVQDIYEVLKENPLPKDLYVDNYKMDIWVFAALQKLDINFSVKTNSRPNNVYETRLISVGGLSENSKCNWALFVNERRSKQYISTQQDIGVKKISFKYECKECKEEN